jgi:hypothetical protein
MSNNELSWSTLAKRFSNIIDEAGGRSKSKSGLIRIEYDSCDDEIHVELGTYDIGMWPSWSSLGSFKSEQDAMQAVSKKLDEAVTEIIREKMQEQQCNGGKCQCCD